MFTAFFLVTTLAGAGTERVDRAEYLRLSTEIRSLSDRNAWTGVERAYVAAAATLQPLSYRDHVAGAAAAGARGDAATARQRLHLAHRLREDRKIVEWLWALDTDYGRVELTSALGVLLHPTQRPFDPSQARAVRFAAQSVAQSGLFVGLLPVGAYRLGDEEFQVQAGTSAVQVHTEVFRGRMRRRPARAERVMLHP
jgi:hypothetical protein